VHLIPSWAPNAHPLLVHFPIVLIMLAALVDLVNLGVGSESFGRAGVGLYVLASLSAVGTFFTGWSAAASVFLPGMAHALVNQHRAWGLTTTAAFVVFAFVRVGIGVLRNPRTLGHRILVVTLSLILVVLVQQTAERGARLVYEQGVGVITGPSPAAATPR
jgi:uncharacterized membrane protein